MSPIDRRDEVTGLNDRQLEAIDLLVAGRKLVDIERSIPVSHKTLWTWRSDPRFRAALAKARYEAHEARVDRLWANADKAMEVIERSLDEGDPVAAGNVLKLVAKGLTDITYRQDPDTHHELPGPREEVHTEERPTGHSLSGAQSEGYSCPERGTVAKSSRGLHQHRSRKHGEA